MMIDGINVWNIALFIDHDISLANVTLHDETQHNVLTTNFELRSPLPTTTFELLLLHVCSV